jgi:nicotinamidase-related amidase
MVIYDDQTAATYRAAGFGERVPRGRSPGLLVVDLTRGFTEPGFATGADLTATVEATNALIAAARTRSVPVIFTAIAYSEAEANGASVAWLAKSQGLRELVEGTDAVALDPRLERRPGDLVVVKKGASAFFGTHVAAALAALGVDTLVVCGATTSGCVRATVVDAVQSGFHVLVPEQAVGDRAAGPHAANLYDINQKYGDVVDLDDALDYLGSAVAVSA